MKGSPFNFINLNYTYFHRNVLKWFFGCLISHIISILFLLHDMQIDLILELLMVVHVGISLSTLFFGRFMKFSFSLLTSISFLP